MGKLLGVLEIGADFAPMMVLSQYVVKYSLSYIMLYNKTPEQTWITTAAGDDLLMALFTGRLRVLVGVQRVPTRH